MSKDNAGVVDHLFRHHYGKMVSTLVRIFGLPNLEMIEDAVQDTFVNAMLKWRAGVPENPEGWLTKAAKNRVIDLIRKIKADQNRVLKMEHGSDVIAINELFLDHQIEDSQLRMIFTACHPKLNPKDQIAFALKTIAGFSDKEIAVALLLKQETVKKRLSRARKTIVEESISFSIPDAVEMNSRLGLVHEVLYLIFNEGFHSTKKDMLVRSDLCGEAIRLCTMLLKKEHYRSADGYALFALFCLHAARLETKVLDNSILVDLKNQDRSKWQQPLITIGKDALRKAMNYENFSTYHFEAVIAAEHVIAPSFESTNWENILKYRQILHDNNPTDYSAMNLAIVYLQLKQPEKCIAILENIQPSNLEKRAYLFYGIKAEYFIYLDNKPQAIHYLELAIENVSNLSEKAYLEKKKADLGK